MIPPNLSFHEYLGSFEVISNSFWGGYFLGIFCISIFVSYVLPLPEAVALLMFGFLAEVSGLDLGAVIIVSVVGTVIGDNFLYRLSFFGNKYIERFNKKMRANKLIQYENLVLNNLGKTIFFLRLITGVRFFGPVISGTLGASWKKFALYNGGATIIHATLYILLGFYLHERIIALVAEVEIVRNILLFSSVLIVGFLIKIFSKKSK